MVFDDSNAGSHSSLKMLKTFSMMASLLWKKSVILLWSCCVLCGCCVEILQPNECFGRCFHFVVRTNAVEICRRNNLGFWSVSKSYLGLISLYITFWVVRVTRLCYDFGWSD
jgi:hypothetical protein